MRWVDASLLFALNAWIVWRLFFLEYHPYFSSIEGAFIGLARYISQNWRDLSWWPLWYGGMPYENTYVPLLHWVTAAVSALAGVSVARAYHLAVGMAYSLGPASLYWMARGLGAARGAAVAVGLAFSLFSPSAVLMPGFAVDMGSVFHARRLQVMVVYGEGPHVAGIAFLALAILALQRALERRSARNFGLAALAIALVLMTNTPASVALVLAVFCWLLAHARGWLTAAGVGLLAYGLSAFAIPPSTVARTSHNVRTAPGGFAFNAQKFLVGLAVLAALVAVAWLLHRLHASLVLRFGMLYFLLIGCLAWIANEARLELIPEAGRFHLEMEWGFALAAAGLVAALWARSPRRLKEVLLVGVTVGIAVQIHHYRSYARSIIRSAGLTSRSEYRTARWLDQNMQGHRVFVPGSTAFWLNAFTDTPQLTGCCVQSNSNPLLLPVVTLIISPGAPEASVLWLQALGVHAVAVSGPESTEEYKDFRDPKKFDGVLEGLHREAGEVIYRVPQSSASLAHVVSPEELAATPDMPQLRRYVEARRPAQFLWVNRHRATIDASLRSGEVLSVQISYTNGWKATANGVSRRVFADGLGLLAVDPDCGGPCAIDLEWGGSPDLAAARWLSAGSWALLIVLLSRRASPWPPSTP